MSWKMHPKEFERVTGLPNAERYEYFVKRVADWQNIWSLRDAGGWSVAGTDDGREVVPVWPHERFAAECASDQWEGQKPAAISLDDWMNAWLPGLQRDGRLIAVSQPGTSPAAWWSPQCFATTWRRNC